MGTVDFEVGPRRTAQEEAGGGVLSKRQQQKSSNQLTSARSKCDSAKTFSDSPFSADSCVRTTEKQTVNDKFYFF